MKQEFNLAAVLIVSQLAMVGVAVSLVVSPSYSAFFNQMLKEQALGSFRANFASEQSSDLTRLLHKRGLDSSFIDLHIDEQIALDSIARKGKWSKQTLPEFRGKINRLKKGIDTTSDAYSAALVKLVRLELAGAEAYLAQRAYSKAEALVAAATEDLKMQTSYFDIEPQKLNLEKIFDLSYRIAHAEGNVDGENKALSLKALLADPVAAKEWFNSHGMKGYEGSYPAEYMIKSIMASQDSLGRANSLDQALEVCKRADVRPSTRVIVMQTAANVAFNERNPVLAANVLDVWMIFGAPLPVQYRPEAVLATSLPRLVSGDTPRAVRAKVMQRVLEGIDRDLVDRHTAQSFFDGFELDCLRTRLWPPPNAQAARARRQEIDGLLAVCNRKKYDDFHLQIAKVGTLIVSREPGDAEKIVCRLLDGKRTSFVEQEMLSRVVVEVTTLIGREHVKSAYAHSLRLIEHALASCNWLDGPKVRLLCHSYGYIPKNRQAEKPPLLKEIRRLSRTAFKTKEESRSFNFFLLHSVIFEENNYEAGNDLVNELKAAYGKDSPEFLWVCEVLLCYRRAYPSYSAQTLAVSLEKPFPRDVFEAAPEMVAKAAGRYSARHTMSLLYLAEFEFCRKKMDRAKAILHELLSLPHAERMGCYLAARDLLAEIEGQNPDYPKQEVVAAKNSELELTCLMTLYRQVKHFEAADRLEKYKAFVRERF